MEDLPKPLALLSASLAREAASLTLHSQLLEALRESQSPLSFLRQSAYQRISLYLSDASSAGPVLDALLEVACWDALLGSLREGLGWAGEGAEARLASPHATTEQELVALLAIFQVACMVHPAAKRSVCEGGLLPLLLGRLPAAQPALVCSILDTLLSVQLNYAPAFQLLVELGGMQQVSRLIQSPAAPEKVRGWGARWLNLTLTHLAPALLEAAAAAPAPDGGRASAGGGGGPAALQLQRSLDAALAGVEEVLGRDAAGLVTRRVSLQDGQAESKLEQLGRALSFFLHP